MTRSVPTALHLVAAICLVAACSDEPGKRPSDCTTCDRARLTVSDPNARACEALVEARGGRVSSVTFDDALEGRSVTEGDRSGLAWTAKADAPATKTSTAVAFTGTLSLLESHCYDADGKLIADSVLELQLADEAAQ